MKNISALYQLGLWLAIMLLLPSSGLTLFAQSASEDLETAFQRLVEEDKISFELEARCFEKEGDDQGKINFTGIFKKDGNSLYTNAWGREIFLHQNQLLLIDHNREGMQVGRSHPLLGKDKILPNADIDSLLKQSTEIIYLGNSTGLYHYRIEGLEGMIYQVEFYLDQNKMLRKMIQYFQDVEGLSSRYQRIELNYRNLKLSAPDGAFFSGAKYFRRTENGQLQSLPPYSNYSIDEVDYDALSNAQF